MGEDLVSLPQRGSQCLAYVSARACFSAGNPFTTTHRRQTYSIPLLEYKLPSAAPVSPGHGTQLPLNTCLSKE